LGGYGELQHLSQLLIKIIPAATMLSQIETRLRSCTYCGACGLL